MNKLSASITTKVRFNEVDSMGIVWHGSYVQFLEDAREEFGKKYDIGYLKIFEEGYYSPLVSLDLKYKSPLIYGDSARIEIEFVDTESAKIQFVYTIYNVKDNKIVATASSIQVFLDKQYQMQLYSPDFYLKWKNHFLY